MIRKKYVQLQMVIFSQKTYMNELIWKRYEHTRFIHLQKWSKNVYNNIIIYVVVNKFNFKV